MKEHPIIFSTPMVQAILEGRKTQTRRLFKVGKNIITSPDEEIISLDETSNEWAYQSVTGLSGPYLCPYGIKGDTLWVRECFRKYYRTDEHGYIHFDNEIIEYAADNPEPIYQMDGDGFFETNKDGSEKFIPWKPSIHMPKEAARIFLEVTNIKVERLQDISEEDAIAEGVERVGDISKGGFLDYMNYSHPYMSAINSYISLWGSINGLDNWKQNPWVWVIDFKRIER